MLPCTLLFSHKFVSIVSSFSAPIFHDKVECHLLAAAKAQETFGSDDVSNFLFIEESRDIQS